MNEHAGKTRSVWMETSSIPTRQKLGSDTQAEVCVIGAGIAGITTAYLLAREGKSVVVLDDGPLCGGETERTTAHLSSALDDGYVYLEQKHGPEGARLNAESHQAAIDLIERLARSEAIDCDFERLDGYLFQPEGLEPSRLEEELMAARRAGLAAQLVGRAPIPTFNTGPAIRFPRLAQFHPLKYLAGLILSTERRGGRFFTHTRAQTVEDGTPATVHTEDSHTVRCQAVVVATNSPINDRYKIHTKQAAYRTYVVGLRVPTGLVPRALYWDTAQDAESAREGHLAPYHYVRLQTDPQGDVLVVGGEDHKTGHEDDYPGEERWAALETWARRRFPFCGDVVYRWSGQVLEPFDGVAFIGRNPGDQHVYISTGDSGHGMTHGTIAGLLLTDLIQNRPNAWERVYDPARKMTGELLEFTRENLDVGIRYGEHLTSGDVRSIEQIPCNSGAVIREGLHKLAVYRDEAGHFHRLSAVCPHLKCVVHWNSAERSWDCPCHGSRFNRFGEVINGPAVAGLERIESGEEGRKRAA